MKLKKAVRVEEHEHDEEEEGSGSTQAVGLIIPRDEELRLLGLYGEIEEVKISQLIGALIDMSEANSMNLEKQDKSAEKEATADTSQEEESKDAEVEQTPKIRPIEMLVSTPGGNADDMFALYDIMRIVREKCDIVTFGIGKVMSAGVLLLASGTKGKRKIGANCRVMIHSVMAGSQGSIHDIENEMQEIKFMQDAYIRALSAETNMSQKKLKSMINKKVNIYLSAEEAVELGIADIIV
jgi:ATP-dependent Clp endopeptidase proteolytic subunit ClpP